MAMKYIANEYELVIPAQLDDWVNRFEKVVLKHLMSKDCADWGICAVRGNPGSTIFNITHPYETNLTLPNETNIDSTIGN